MSTSIIIIFMFVCIGTVCGYSVCKYYKSRKIYFNELKIFLQSYLSKITYCKDTIISILMSHTTQSKLLHTHLREYMDSLIGVEKLVLTKQYLKASELQLIYSIFDVMGKTDLISQENSVHGKIVQLDSVCKIVDEQFNKNGNSSIKLGLLGGLLVGIICI